jgi:hypothetical protein
VPGRAGVRGFSHTPTLYTLHRISGGANMNIRIIVLIALAAVVFGMPAGAEMNETQGGGRNIPTGMQ